MKSVMASRATFIIAELTVVGSVLFLFCGVGYKWHRRLLLYNKPTLGDELNDTMSDTKNILYYTTYFGREDWGIGVGKGPFHSCPVSNCHVTHDFRFADRDGFGGFDAVLFHLDNTFGCPFMGTAQLKKFRNPDQRFVAVTLQSPNETRFMPTADFDDFFNWTMTYRDTLVSASRLD